LIFRSSKVVVWVPNSQTPIQNQEEREMKVVFEEYEMRVFGLPKETTELAQKLIDLRKKEDPNELDEAMEDVLEEKLDMFLTSLFGTRVFSYGGEESILSERIPEYSISEVFEDGSLVFEYTCHCPCCKPMEKTVIDF
jgi:hypothetical protein